LRQPPDYMTGISRRLRSRNPSLLYPESGITVFTKGEALPNAH
jgi:hypothetical protein